MRKYLIIAAILQITWGLVPSASKYVIDEIPVELYITIRWTISGLIFATYLLLRKEWRAVNTKDVAAVSILGLLGHGCASFGTLYGLKLAGVTSFSLMWSLSPVVVTGMSIWLLKERPHRLFKIALPIAVIGLILVVLGKYQVSSVSITGLSTVLIVGAIFLEALVFISSKRFKQRMTMAQYLAISQVTTAIFMWILQLTVFHQVGELGNLTGQGIAGVLFVSVVACVLCYTVLYWLLNYVDGHRLALFDGVHALSATSFGFLLFDEPIRPMMILGGVLILVGLITGNLPRNLTDETPE